LSPLTLLIASPWPYPPPCRHHLQSPVWITATFSHSSSASCFFLYLFYFFSFSHALSLLSTFSSSLQHNCCFIPALLRHSLPIPPPRRCHYHLLPLLIFILYLCHHYLLHLLLLH
ncbi:unnamed protein product, partial [Musa acuminata var. zebrina]